MLRKKKISKYPNSVALNLDDELYARLKYCAGVLEMPVSAFMRLILRNGIDIVVPTLLGERWAFINQAYKDELKIPKPKGKLLL